MSITIRQTPFHFETFRISPCGASFRVDLPRTMRTKLSNKAWMTRDMAIKTLGAIQWKSNLKALLTKPFLWITSGALLLLSGALIALIPIIPLAFAVASVGGAILGYMINHHQTFARLSRAYQRQNVEIRQYLDELHKADAAMHVIVQSLSYS